MIRPQVSNPCAVSTAAELLALGHLVAFPTETVYGLGADGLNPKAVAKIFAAKGRPADHPVILHVADIDRARSLASDWPSNAEKLATAFWPGPLTLILRRASHVPDAVTGGQDTVGVRMPSHPVALSLLKDFSTLGSGVVAAPSANRFGAVSPTRALDVVASLGDRLGPQDMILDGGDCAVGVESTIVDLSSGEPKILRPGGISREAIESVLGMRLSQTVTDAPRVSGSLESHYAPRATTMLVAPHELLARLHGLQADQQGAERRIVCLVMNTDLARELSSLNDVIWLPMSADPQIYAHDLYARLNDADRFSADFLLIESPPQTVEWEAVNDRLKRAAAV